MENISNRMFGSYMNVDKNALRNTAEDRNQIANLLVQSSFGLPPGTIRAAIALMITMAFVVSAFYFEQMPDAIKVVGSLVFGFYFAKSSAQAKDVMEIMLGKGKNRELKKQEALSVLAEAEIQSADSRDRLVLRSGTGVCCPPRSGQRTGSRGDRPGGRGVQEGRRRSALCLPGGT